MRLEMVKNAWELFQEYNELNDEQLRVVKCINKAKKMKLKNIC